MDNKNLTESNKSQNNTEIKNVFPLCMTCYNALNSIHNSIFSFNFNDVDNYELINLFIMYLEIFKINTKNVNENDKIHHLFNENKSICNCSINELIDIVRKRIIDKKIPTDDNYFTNMYQ